MSTITRERPVVAPVAHRYGKPCLSDIINLPLAMSLGAALWGVAALLAYIFLG